MRVSAASDVGKVRNVNEDSYCDVVHPDFDALRLVAVADGMGGHQAGEVASKLATGFICERFERLLDLAQPREWLAESFLAANSAIVDRATQATEVAGMGTTLTAALFIDNRAGAGSLPKTAAEAGTGLRLIVGHVGDSRMYLYRAASKELLRITEDHSFVGELLRNGDLTEEEAQQHPQRNYLTQALGSRQPIQVDSAEFELTCDDIVILCTDGLTSLLPQSVIQQEIEKPDLDGAATRLVNQALELGGHDNITVVLVRT